MHIKKTKAVIMANNVPFYKGDIIDYVYGSKRIEKIRSITDLYPIRITSENLKSEISNLKDVEVIFSSWGMLPLTDKELDSLPNLKAVFYAGGSVNGFARPFIDRGITICSAVEANAIPVAEFCLAQILLSCKGAYRNSDICRKGKWQQSEMPVGKGVYGETVALLGIGAISRYLLKLLKPFNLRIIAVSNYLSERQAKELGISELVTIEEAFEQGYVVSNHLADKVSNKGILTKNHFASMRKDATFINTGRGAQVDEFGLIEVLKSRPDIVALLDVQYPEPPEDDSELYDLPNIYMTSHIAGSTNDEVQRMSDFVIKDFERWINDEPMLYEVDENSLKARA